MAATVPAYTQLHPKLFFLLFLLDVSESCNRVQPVPATLTTGHLTGTPVTDPFRHPIRTKATHRNTIHKALEPSWPISLIQTAAILDGVSATRLVKGQFATAT